MSSVRAAAWLALSCALASCSPGRTLQRSDDPPAGTMHAAGRGAAIDRSEARRLLERGCAPRDEEACLTLATLLYEGRHLDQDKGRAGQIFRRLCDAGVPTGCTLAGILDQRGPGAALSGPALAHAEALCERSHALACSVLGSAYFDGAGVTQDRARAAHLLERGCDAGSGIACLAVAGQHATGDGIARDEARALRYYELACAADQGMGCAILGLAHLQGQYGLAEDHARGAGYLDRGCRTGSQEACSAWAMCLRAGDGVARDLGRAKLVLDGACRAGHADSCARRGAMWADEGDLDQAGALFERGCTLGAQLGCDAAVRLQALRAGQR